jgi:dTDP-4-dehydrorhamnose 3,5-epimerase
MLERLRPICQTRRHGSILAEKSMLVETFDIAGPCLITPTRHGDARGFFAEVYRQDLFDEVATGVDFVQDNHSRSRQKGVLRGLHFQRPPMAQSKLVRVTRGAVFDVAVDAREGSSTYGRHIAVELSEDNGRQLWVPKGFLHGFCTLTDDTEFLYKVDAYYSAENDGTIAFDDPDLAIDWPFPREGLTLSKKDEAAPRLRDAVPPFPRGSVAPAASLASEKV